MVKAHSPINWENEPSQNTPVNEANLNKMDSTIGILDDRIIAQDTSKLDKSTANTMVKDVAFNESTGIFTITLLNGSTKTLDTKIEKIATNFRYDYSTQKLILTLVDGTTQEIDMSTLLTQYEFTDSATIDFSVGSDGKITATIKNGSITEDMLQPNYLAEIKVETEKSAQSMANAKISENNAKQSELNAKASEEQALEYSNNAQPVAQSVSGNNPTATNSADGNVIYLNNKGYTQQDGTPSPDNPIHIGGLADKGYFDGELLQGYYNYGVGDTVSFVSSANVVCNTNIIHCNGGDSVALQYENSATLRVIFADENMKSLASESVDDIQITMVAPLQTKYLLFVIEGDNITPSTAKHISVTINGQYAVRVKTCGKNIFDYRCIGNRFSNNSTGTTHTYSNGEFVIARVANIYSGIYSYADELNVLKGKKIKMTLDVKTDTSGMNISVALASLSLIEKPITTGYARYSFEFDLTDVENAYPLIIYGNAVAGNMYIKDIMFEDITNREATDDTYEPYTETQALIPTSSPFYEGDYLEVYADGSGKIYRVNKEIYVSELTRTFVGNPLTNTQMVQFNRPSDMKNGGVKSKYYCDRFTYIKGTLWGNDTLGLCSSIEGANYDLMSFRIPVGSDGNVYFTDNPTKIVYPLETPTETPLTAEQVQAFKQLQTFKSVTHINADGEVTVRYYCNNDSGNTVGMLHEMVESNGSHELIASVQKGSEEDTVMVEVANYEELSKKYKFLLLKITGWDQRYTYASTIDISIWKAIECFYTDGYSHIQAVYSEPFLRLRNMNNGTPKACCAMLYGIK